MFEAAALSGYAGALAFAVLSALLLAADQGHRIGRLLIAAAALSALWFALGAAYYGGHHVGVEILGLSYLELLRDLAWFAFLAAVLLSSDEPGFRRRVTRIVAVAVVAMALAAIVSLASQSLISLPGALSDPAMLRKASALCFLAIAILGIVIIEQLIRTTRADARWSIKHLSLGVGAIFAFDFYLYADALLFNRINGDVWAARGIVNAFSVPLIALAAARNRDWARNLRLQASRVPQCRGARRGTVSVARIAGGLLPELLWRHLGWRVASGVCVRCLAVSRYPDFFVPGALATTHVSREALLQKSL